MGDSALGRVYDRPVVSSASVLGNSRFSRTLSRTLLVLGAIGVTLAVLEVVFRFVVPASTHHQLYRVSPDPALGVDLVPGADFLFEGVATPIPPTRVSISSQGLRNAEVTVPKPPGTRRLLCVGDSTTFGWGVEGHETFCHLLAGLLPAGWETVNLGVPGYNTTQEVRRLEVHGLPLEPDLVLVLFDGNDYEPPIEYGGTDDTLTWLTDRSALVRWIVTRVRGSQGPPPGEQGADPSETGASSPETRPWNGEAEVLAALTRLLALRAQHGFDLMVLMPNDEEDQAVRGVLATAGVPHPSIRAALWGPPEQVFIPNDGHPNAEGHRRIAALIASQLQTAGLIRTSAN